MPDNASQDQEEGADVSTDVNIDEWIVKPHCGLTMCDDPTVGGEGNPYAGIGNSQLPEQLRHLGEAKRHQIFPNY